jgi:Family of unknown function (DUF6116)
MSSPVRSPVTSLLGRLLPRLRFPQLFAILAGLLVLDLLLPDPIPLVDELTLAVLTFLVGSWRRREPQQEPRDVTPPDDRPPSLPPARPESGT